MVFRILITHKLTNDYEQKVIHLCFSLHSFLTESGLKRFSLMPIMVIYTIYRKTFFLYINYGNFTIY